jgi:hypothetical protein
MLEGFSDLTAYEVLWIIQTATSLITRCDPGLADYRQKHIGGRGCVETLLNVILPRENRIEIPHYPLAAKPGGEQIKESTRVASRIVSAVADKYHHVRPRARGPCMRDYLAI